MRGITTIADAMYLYVKKYSRSGIYLILRQAIMPDPAIS